MILVILVVMLEVVLTLSISSLPLPSSLSTVPPSFLVVCYDVLSGASSVDGIKANNSISYGNSQCVAVMRLCVVTDEGCDTLRTGKWIVWAIDLKKRNKFLCVFASIIQHNRTARKG